MCVFTSSEPTGSLMRYDVRLPPELFIRAAETREPQVWTDDRGYTYEVRWSEEHHKPLAYCVGIPGDEDFNYAWFRDTPAPEVRL